MRDNRGPASLLAKWAVSAFAVRLLCTLIYRSNPHNLPQRILSASRCFPDNIVGVSYRSFPLTKNATSTYSDSQHISVRGYVECDVDNLGPQGQ